MRTMSEIMTLWAPIPYECRRTSCDAFDVIFSKIQMMKIPLTSNKDLQNVANRLKDAGKLLKVHRMFKLKVELEVCSVCYITGNCSQKYGYTTPLKCRKSHLLTML